MTGIRAHFRKILLILLFGTILPSPAWAKTLIGVMLPGDSPYFLAMHQAFLTTLAASSRPGTDFAVAVQKPFPDATALSNAARKLLAAEPDLVVTYGASATLAVINERSRVPLIYGGVYDPAPAQFSGPNITGCGYKVPLSSLLRHLRELKTVETLNVFYSSLEEDSVRQVNELAELAKGQQLTLNLINLKSREELKPSSLAKGDAVFLTGSSLVASQLGEILALAKTRQLPSVGIFPDPDEAGITIALYQDPVIQGKKIAEMAAQIIGGRHPREIKPESMRNTDLLFNLREAKNLGVKIPFQLVAEAGKVTK